MTIDSKAAVQASVRRALDLREMSGNPVVRQVCEDLIELGRYMIEKDDKLQAERSGHPSAGTAERVTGTELSQIGRPRVLSPNAKAIKACDIPPKPVDAPADVRWNGTHWVRD